VRVRSLIVAAAMAGMAATLPAAALAHAELVSTTPTPGDNLQVAPSGVTLTFDEELNPDGSSFTVVDAGGGEVGAGEVDLTVADRNVMIGVVNITEPGVYTVAYTAVAADGHVSSGTFSFGFQAEEAIPQPTTRDEPDTALPRAVPVATLLGTLLLVLAGMGGLRRLALR
jgi:copper resistance protein C